MAEAQAQAQPQESEGFKGLEATVEVSDENNKNAENENVNVTNIPHLAEDENTSSESKEPTPRDKPDYIPEKFWDAKKGEVREEEAFKSIAELEKAFSQGKHKAPEEYETETLKSKGYAVDDPIVSKYIDWAKDNGVSQKAFDDLVKSIVETSGEVKENYETDEKAELEKLGPNANEIIKSNKLWANGLHNKGLLNDEEREEISVLAYTAAGQKTLQKLRALMGETRAIPTTDVATPKETEAEFQARMQSKMGDERYGNDRSFTMEIEKEFEQRYGKKQTG